MTPKFKVGDVIKLVDEDIWEVLEITGVSNRMYQYTILNSNWWHSKKFSFSSIGYIDAMSRKLTKLDKALQ